MVNVPTVLFLTTSAGVLTDGTKTGLWLEELAVPYMLCLENDLACKIASVRAGPVPYDPRSLVAGEESAGLNERFMMETPAAVSLGNAPAVTEAMVDAATVLFLPGGHGAMMDFSDEGGVAARAVERSLANGSLVAAISHGPAALVGARWPDGGSVVQGRTVTAFSDQEESALGLGSGVPFPLEQRLRDLGAEVETGEPFSPFVREDEQILTGQNPQSARALTSAVLRRLAARK